jgi:hypothetical protein
MSSDEIVQYKEGTYNNTKNRWVGKGSTELNNMGAVLYLKDHHYLKVMKYRVLLQMLRLTVYRVQSQIIV